MTRRNLPRSLAAGTALCVTIVGLPIALVLFGRSPLDGDGSLWAQVTDTATRPISDTFIFGAFTVACWVAWAIFSLQVAAELAAAFGRQPRWRPPAPGLFQFSARRLVAALTMTVSLAAPLSQRSGVVPALATSETASAQVGPLPAPPDEAAAGDSSATPAIDPAGERPPVQPQNQPVTVATPAPPPAAPPSGPCVTVAPGDTPWALAERHLGNGQRWRDIWALNNGQPQSDGRTWIAEDLIHPGWEFRLPDDAGNLPAPPNGAAATPAPSSPPAAPNPAEQPPTPPEPPSNPAPDIHDETSPSSVTPDTTEPQPGDDQAATTPSTAQPNQSAPDETRQPTDKNPPNSNSRPAIPLLGAAATLLAAGVVRHIRRARTRRNASLPAGAVAPRTPQSSIDRELYEAADEDTAGRLDSALAHLATRTSDRPGFTAPRVIQLADQRVDILLDRADPKPPKPWRAETAGLIWVLDPNKQPEATEAPTALPTLVTVGTGEAHILIDLEAHGVVALVGDRDRCKAMARSMVTELAARNDVAPNTTIIANALDPADLNGNGVTIAQAWTEQHTSTITTFHDQLHATGSANTWQARGGGQPLDGWPPAVWFSTHQSGDRYYQQAIETVVDRPGAGSAIVVVGEDPCCGLHVHVNADGTFEIPDHGLHGQAQLLDTDATTQIVGILEHANDTSLDAQIIEQATNDRQLLVVEDAVIPTGNNDAGDDGYHSSDGDTRPESTDQQDSEQPATYEDPEHTVLVRLCGPIRIDGSKRQLYNPETAATAYIALNGTTDLDTLRDVVWRGAVSAKRARNSISNIRAAVGEAITWTPQGRLTTGPGLTTDLELIKRRLRHAENRPPPEQIDILEEALQLVTGRTCTYPTGGQRFWKWIDLDDWMAHVDPIIGTLATRLANLHLQHGDGSAATRTSQLGIEAIGQRDDLVILQVKGHELNGEQAAARGVVRRYEQYLNDLGVDEHNEELLDLFDRYAD